MNAQYLTFAVGGEEYGLAILHVQEIKGRAAITKIPNAPPHVAGVMNLRGSIIPVIDLRVRFSIEVAETQIAPVIVVVKVAGRTTGIIVDTVSEVLEVPAEQVQSPEDIGGSIGVGFLEGMAHVNGRLIGLLDIAGVLNDREAAEVG